MAKQNRFSFFRLQEDWKLSVWGCCCAPVPPSHTLSSQHSPCLWWWGGREREKYRNHGLVQFSSAAQSCLTLCDLMVCSMPRFPVHHQLPEFTQTHVHWVQWCHLTISSSVIPFSSHLKSFPASGSFQMSHFFASSGQSFGVSASASVLPMNIQGWFPLEWTGWISLQSKGLSRVFSNITVQKHQFFSAQLSL